MPVNRDSMVSVANDLRATYSPSYIAEQLYEQAKLSEKIDKEEAIAEVLDFLGTPADYWEKTNLEGKFMLHNLVFTANPMYDAQNG